jgi:hypothetical protein
MNFFGSLLCILDFHKFSPWIEKSGCIEKCTCSKCDVTWERVQHRWDEGFHSDPEEPCVDYKKCVQCGAKTGPIRTTHDWECVSHYLHRCKICGLTQRHDQSGEAIGFFATCPACKARGVDMGSPF